MLEQKEMKESKEKTGKRYEGGEEMRTDEGGYPRYCGLEPG